MKTLDEVLEAMTYEVGLNSKANCWEVPVDLYGVIIHYLHEYREQRDQIDALPDYYDLVNFWEDSQANSPLSWNELKTMEGKPVWVEDNLETPEDTIKYWAIMRRIEKTEGDEYALLSDFYYEKSQYGKDWMAYRKERK